jgi:DNA-binding LytR/AlgR family response regulator
VYCFVSLVIPYVIAGMFFAIVDKNRTIRLMNYETVVSDENLPVSKLEKVTLFDNNGVLKLSVSSSSLYYVESDDNYIIVWYTDSKGDLKRYMLRCRLKTVEESFKGSSLVRCHRKYIVNMDKVKVLRKERDGYELDLDNDAIPPIPITKTYADNVLDRFNTARR